MGSTQLFATTQGHRCFDAVHHRHPHIHQDHVEALFFNGIQRFLTIFNTGDRASELSQHPLRDHGVYRVILNEEDLPSFEPDFVSFPDRLWFNLRSDRLFERECEEEGAAALFDAGHSHLAPPSAQ